MNSSLFDDRFFVDPYPVYSALRQRHEPLQVNHIEGNYQREFLLFSRYSDARVIFSLGDAVSKNIRAVRPKGSETPFDLHLLHRDEPDHLRLRKLIQDYFSLPYVVGMEQLITEVVDTLVDGFAEKDNVDLIADYAEPLPLHVMARLMGLPLADTVMIRQWSLTIMEGFDSFVVAERDQSRLHQALADFLRYVEGLIERAASRRLAPDLVVHLVEGGCRGELDRDELLGMLVFLIFAGHETTINLIGNGLWLLLSHPRQLEVLREEPTLIRSAVEEVLRYESPEQRTSFRVATKIIELDGYRLQPGQQFGVIIGSANRDEAAFENADIFDIRRTQNRHFAFGAGLHNCIGKHLARQEGRLAFERLLWRYPHMTLQSEQPSWRENSFFRGLYTLPVTLGEGVGSSAD